MKPNKYGANRDQLPVPTKWRCDCGRLHTTDQRCHLKAPWEREDERVAKECAALALLHDNISRQTNKTYWQHRKDERARMRATAL